MMSQHKISYLHIFFTLDVVYEGEFDDGMFHGEGELKYPSGEILRGTWKKGQLTNRKLIFADGLEYSETDWMYCRIPDRRWLNHYLKQYKTKINKSLLKIS